MKKAELVLSIIFAVIFITSCQPSEADIRRALSQTQTAQPTPILEQTPTIEPTPTLISLAEFDLSTILFRPNELPTGYEPAQIRPVYEVLVDTNSIQPINKIRQDLEHQGEVGGNVQVFLYSSSKDAKSVYDSIYNALDTGILKKYSTIGEAAFAGEIDSVELYDLFFIRCNSLVAINVGSRDGYYAGMKDYAKYLDTRLEENFCR